MNIDKYTEFKSVATSTRSNKGEQNKNEKKAKQKPLSFSLHPDNIAYIEAAVLKQKEANHRYSRSMYLDDHITELRLADEQKKVKSKSKVKPPFDAIQYPVNLNVAAWDEWIHYRAMTKLKKYKTNAKMKELAKMGSQAEQMEIVMISINNEYQGLFALKGNANARQNNANAKSSGQKKSAVERVNERNNIKYGQPDECGLGVGADGRHLGGAVDKGKRGITIEHVDKSTFTDY